MKAVRGSQNQSLRTQTLTLFKTQRNFYKAFTRPVAKGFLIAVFTYQLVYYIWVKLETDETKRDQEGR